MQKLINNIHKLRSQPEHVRRHVLHVAIGVAGILMFALWVLSLGASISKQSEPIQASNGATPFDALKANLIGGYESLKEPANPVIQ